MSDEDLKKLIESNAKSIQALTDTMTQDREERKKDREQWRQERKEWQQDRRRVFEWMSRLAAAQADFYEAQADYLHHIERIDDRLAEILERLTPDQEKT